MRYDAVLFDMDGTVMETAPGVINGFKYALNKLNIPFPDVPERLFLGPPLDYSLREYVLLPEKLIPEAVRQYRVYYNDIGIMECKVYEGVRELLELLNARGVKCLVASSKPEPFVNRILRSFGLDGLFFFAAGSDINGKWGTKEEVIKRALRLGEVKDASRCLMVGDRYYDINGAKALGIDSCGILWGYGVREEFEESGATYIVEKPKEIADII